MAKRRNRAADFAVYLAVRLLVHFLQSLSLGAAHAVARGLAWLAHRLDRRHREVALDNLRHAYPAWTDERRRDVVRAVYRHFCTVLVEMVHLPRKIRPTNWRRYLELPDGETLVDVLLSGRPVLIVTGHFGNWEMAGYALGLFGFKSYAVARPLDNPYLDAFLRRFREHTGQQLLAKKGEVDRMQDILDRGGVICTLADQDAGQQGLYVDFFGRPASTHKAIALLALRHRAVVLVCGAQKVGEPMRYAVRCTDVLWPEDFEGDPRAVRNFTQRYTAALERLARLAPEQYFWLHRRWKHQPKEKEKAVRRAA
jgi:KDO2-lipid IV(A) lauroyltransferase